MVDLFEADGISGEPDAEMIISVARAKTSAAGDHDGAILKYVVRLGSGMAP